MKTGIRLAKTQISEEDGRLVVYTQRDRFIYKDVLSALSSACNSASVHSADVECVLIDASAVSFISRCIDEASPLKDDSHGG